MDLRFLSVLFEDDHWKYNCRCDGMVDVVDSKSTAGDSVPVRVRSPAPNKKERLLPLFFIWERKRTRTHLNATRTSVARCGWTQRNLNFLPTGENANRVRGARGALPVADEATRASGRGRCATQPHRRQGAHRITATGHRHHLADPN